MAIFERIVLWLMVALMAVNFGMDRVYYIGSLKTDLTLATQIGDTLDVIRGLHD